MINGTTGAAGNVPIPPTKPSKATKSWAELPTGLQQGASLAAYVLAEVAEAYVTLWLWNAWLVPLGFMPLRGAMHAWVITSMIQMMVTGNTTAALHALRDQLLPKDADADTKAARLEEAASMSLRRIGGYALMLLVSTLVAGAFGLWPAR